MNVFCLITNYNSHVLHPGVLGYCMHVGQGTQPPISLLKNSDFAQEEPVRGTKGVILRTGLYIWVQEIIVNKLSKKSRGLSFVSNSYEMSWEIPFKWCGEALVGKRYYSLCVCVCVQVVICLHEYLTRLRCSARVLTQEHYRHWEKWRHEILYTATAEFHFLHTLLTQTFNLTKSLWSDVYHRIHHHQMKGLYHR